MKKIAITGIILVLVMMFVATCDEEPEIGVEYTDVEYAPDGSAVTLYLDGVGVPVTPAQRAINRETAMMAYDYFEVIFVGGTADSANTARTAWELGMPAGITNVPRGSGTPPAGIEYAYAANATTNVAVMFVGRKDGKTLFGVGFITGSKWQGTTAPSTVTTVNGNTTSVTFSINAIQTGLLVKSETIDTGAASLPGTAVAGVMANSFDFVATGTTVTTAPTKANNSERVNLGGVNYPKYTLPEENGKVVNASYTFYYASAATSPTNYIRHINVSGTDIPLIMKRVPRFVQSGRYREPGDRWTTLTKVTFNGSYGANGDPFGTAVPIQFKLQGTGIFSFYIQIPVYMHTQRTASFNATDTASETWYIRTGVGSELYNLDDGSSTGGCVFMQVGTFSSTTWLDIDWVWL